ncbi:MAG: hypothetical protein U0269_27385 [Polyangiales bacterium]
MTTLSPNGRWNGRLTSRALPDASESLRGLSATDRTLLANIWLSQCATERRVADSFVVVHRALVELDADPGLIATAERAIDDEYRHTELCRVAASEYAGRSLSEPPLLPMVRPTHPTASSDRVRSCLFVLGQCAFNETFASAYLDTALACAEVPFARAAIRELLSDEVDHSRIGWAFAATLPASERGEVQSWLVDLALCNLREWRKIALPSVAKGEVVRHGVPPRDRVEEALLAVIEGVMIPGFERFGFDARELRAWHAQGAPTD